MEYKICPLYVADSISTLKKIADIEIEEEKGMDHYIRLMYRLTSKVLTSYEKGDQEMEFVHARRSLAVFKILEETQGFRKHPESESLIFNCGVIRPRYEELRSSLKERYRSSGVASEPSSTDIFSRVGDIESVDPELAAFLRHLELAHPREESGTDLSRTWNGSRPEPLHIARTVAELEHISRKLELPGTTFTDCLDRMSLALSLRESIRGRDSELELILIARFLNYFVKARKMPEYKIMFNEYRNVFVKALTMKRAYEDVKQLLYARYKLFHENLNIVEVLKIKEIELKSELEEVKKRKLNWESREGVILS